MSKNAYFIKVSHLQIYEAVFDFRLVNPISFTYDACLIELLDYVDSLIADSCVRLLGISTTVMRAIYSWVLS